MATPTSNLEPALALLLLLGLPACANPMKFSHSRALWSAEEPVLEWSGRVADLAITIAPDPEVAGALSAQAQRVGGEPMPVWSGLVAPRNRWQLTPEDDAAEAFTMLIAAEGFAVHRARLEVQRDYLEGDIVRCDADLRLDVGVDWTAVGTRVDEMALPPATRYAPRNGRRSDLSARGADPAWPALLDRCVDRLADLDLDALLPDAGDVELESWLWVDRERKLVVDKKQVEALCGSGLDRPSLPFAERLARLGRLRLLVVVTTGTERASFLLRPDFVWLCGGLENVDGGAVHRSRWHARSVAAPPVLAAATPVSLVSGTMRLRMFTGVYDHDPMLDFAYNVLGAPFALVLDVLEWMTGAEFVEDKKPKRPGRDWR